MNYIRRNNKKAVKYFTDGGYTLTPVYKHHMSYGSIIDTYPTKLGAIATTAIYIVDIPISGKKFHALINTINSDGIT
jgi:hypothetical protein